MSCVALFGVPGLLAGAVAQRTSPATAMAVLAALSVAVTLLLAPGLRGTRAVHDAERPAPPDPAAREAAP